MGAKHTVEAGLPGWCQSRRARCKLATRHCKKSCHKCVREKTRNVWTHAIVVLTVDVWDVQLMVAVVLGLVPACGFAVAEDLAISACERRRVSVETHCKTQVKCIWVSASGAHWQRDAALVWFKAGDERRKLFKGFDEVAGGLGSSMRQGCGGELWHKRVREKTRNVWTHAIVLLTNLCGEITCFFREKQRYG